MCSKVWNPNHSNALLIVKRQTGVNLVMNSHRAILDALGSRAAENFSAQKLLFAISS